MVKLFIIFGFGILFVSGLVFSGNLFYQVDAMKGKGVFLLKINATGSHVCGDKPCWQPDPYEVAKAIEKQEEMSDLEMESNILFGLAGKVSRELYPKYKETSSGELTEITGAKTYGGQTVGNYQILTNQQDVIIIAEFDPPSLDKVLEGWLVDVDSGYVLSLGKFNSDTNILYFNQKMINPWIYDIFEVTEEPIDDVNPKPHTPLGGVPLIDLVGSPAN